MVIYLPQEFSEAVKTFLPEIHAVYLTESENIIEPKGIESSRKIKETQNDQIGTKGRPKWYHVYEFLQDCR